MRPKVGFTLLELILVVVIIIILVSLSTPLFRRTFSDLELKNTSFNIAKLVNYAQEMAIIEKVPHKLNFDFEEKQYWISKKNTTGEGPDFTRLTGKRGRTLSLPQGLHFTGKTYEITFYPDGSCEKAEIIVVDGGGNGRMLQVEGFGSKVTIVNTEDEE